MLLILPGFLYGIEALKSVILTVAAAERKISAEKASFLSRLELEYQVIEKITSCSQCCSNTFIPLTLFFHCLTTSKPPHHPVILLFITMT